jgi:tetratricopeptide (TPR) repeat protein
MKILTLLIFITSLCLVGAPSGYAQNSIHTDYLSHKIAAFSEAEEANNTALAGALASELSSADFSQLGFTPHESRELLAGLVDALANARQLNQAAGLLNYLAAKDRHAYISAATAEEVSFYRNVLIDRLMQLVELNQRRQKGDELIETLSAVRQLLLEQLGEYHPDVQPLTTRLIENLQGRARFLVHSNRAEDGLNELWTAYDLHTRYANLSIEPGASIYESLTSDIRQTTLDISEQYVRQINGDAGINWLSEQFKRMRRDAPFNWRMLVPVAEKLVWHYQSRSAFFEARNDFANAESDLNAARLLLTNMPTTGSLNKQNLNNLHAALLKRWAEHQYTLGDYTAAYDTASRAYNLRPNDPSLEADIVTVYENTYRAAFRIPASQPVNLPARALETIIVQEASTELTVPSGSTGGYSTIIDSPEFKAVRVFYGTNRVPGGNDFKGKGVGPVKYGWSQVTVPTKRDRGVITRNFPGFKPKDDLHFILKRTNRYANANEFGSRLRASLKCDDQVFFENASEPRCDYSSPSGPTELFIYIHGHNTPFKEAALRTAQLAVDLDMENGAVFFAWPTGRHALAYRTSEKYSRQSRKPLRQFLETVISQSNADQIHLIAHSMGNQVLLNALYDLKERQAPNARPLFDQIIFASPDVDQSTFVKDVKAVENLSNGMTLYASNKDKALTLSAKINAEKRAGLAPPDASIINATTKLVVVDTSEVKRRFKDLISHDDYTGGAFNDVRSVLWTKARPENRCVLYQQQMRGSLPFWKARSSNARCSMKEFGDALEGMRGIRPLVARAR